MADELSPSLPGEGFGERLKKVKMKG